MNTSFRQIVMGLGVFVFIAVVFFDFFAFNGAVVPGQQGATQQQTGIAAFPSYQQYLNWNSTYTFVRYQWFGGNWSFQFFNLGPQVNLNWLLNGVAIFVSFFVFIGNFFLYIGLLGAWSLNAVSFPFVHLPYPVNYLVEGIIGIAIGTAVIGSLILFGGGH